MVTWLLLSRLEYGGVERVQLNLARTLRGRGYAVRLVAGKVVSALEDGEREGSRMLEIARKGRWHFPIGLWRALGRDRPELIFTTSNDVACLVLLLRIVRYRSLRVVVTQHLSLSAPRKQSRGWSRIKREMIRMAMRILIPRADQIVAVSQAVALDMCQELEIDARRIVAIYNPIVTVDFEARMNASVQWPWLDRELPTVIFVGRLAAEKRLDLLLASFCELIRRCPARLLIVGTGPQEDQVRKWISENDLAELCRLVGFTTDPLPLIRRADALVLPSDFEGFGNVLVEAMACGIQVVATDCPCGPAEILEHGTYGQLVPCNDAGALAEAMRRALTREFKITPEVLQQRAEAFSVTRSADAYQRIIDSLAGT